MLKLASSAAAYSAAFPGQLGILIGKQGLQVTQREYLSSPMYVWPSQECVWIFGSASSSDRPQCCGVAASGKGNYIEEPFF